MVLFSTNLKLISFVCLEVFNTLSGARIFLVIGIKPKIKETADL